MPVTALQDDKSVKCPRGECRVRGFSSRHSVMSVEGLDGGTASYKICGANRQKRPAILFLSGWGCTPEIWKPTAPHLISDFDLIFVGNRGQGPARMGSITPDKYFSAMANDIEGILNLEQIERALVIGHSMGGLVAKEFARRFSDRVDGIVFVCSPHGNPLGTWALGNSTTVNASVNAISALLQHIPGMDTIKREIIARHPLFRAISGGMLLGTYSGKNGAKKDYERTYRHFLRVDIRTLTTQLEAMRAAVPTNGMKAPALYVWGEDDRLVEWETAYLRAKGREMPSDSSAILLKKTGHFPSVECPEKLARIIREFSSEAGHTLTLAGTRPLL